MGELLEWIIFPIVDFFRHLYDADNRPEARRFTIGCALICVALVLIVGALFYFFG